MPNPWTAKRILKELATPERRRQILADFWSYGDPQAKLLATAYLAKMMHFREETLRKMPADKKADLLASRIGASELDQFLEMGLMAYHTHRANELMAAFLDRWNVPHNNGSIEVDEYNAPSSAEVRDAVGALTQFDRNDVLLYLAAAGLLMGDDWRAAAWPVVDELSAQ